MTNVKAIEVPMDVNNIQIYDGYIVEYILADWGGFCHRASPFLMQVGTVFEHEYGTYKVTSIDRKPKHIIVYCEHLKKETTFFDTLFKLRDEFN